MFSRSILLLATSFFAALPSSSSYKLNNYTFGSGGTAGSSSNSYQLNATAGEQSNGTSTSTAIKNNSGNTGTQNSNVPTVTLTNGNNYYDRLKLVIGIENNAIDTLFAVAISSDNFVTTQYVKSDNTVGSSLTYPTDYRTYASWGSGTGTFVIGLSASTTYKVKAKAIQGAFTETPYGPESSAATVGLQMSYSLTPTTVAFGGITPGSVATAGSTIDVQLSTNAQNGGKVYVLGANAGLHSSAVSYTINSATADLTSAARGFGARVSATGQTGGGPMAAVTPFDGAGNNVGGITTTYQAIISAAAPVDTGTASVQLKAKADSPTVPQAGDYAETLTMVAAASF